MNKNKALLNRELTTAEVQYVLTHLKMLIECDYDFQHLIIYRNHKFSDTASISHFAEEDRAMPHSAGAPKHNYRIFIPQSSDAINEEFRINNIPVLFPCAKSHDLFHVIDGNLIFNHDFIKSAFYLLSCYQEFGAESADRFGRFLYSQSIQKRLDIALTPVVNYYFSWIISGIELFCNQHDINFRKKNTRPGIHITHDVDALRYFSTKNILFRWAQVIGLRKLDMPRSKKLHQALSTSLHALGIANKPNPYNSFNTIMGIEEKMGCKSTWFFMPKDKNNIESADYNLSDTDVIQTMSNLALHNNDVALHAPVSTNTTIDYLADLEQLQKNQLNSLPYCRQHYLAIKQPNSLTNMEDANIMVDCSVGFSHHEGFRNSYCRPYYPFDHEQGRMIGLLEIPLNVMDTTLFEHRRLNYDEVFSQIDILINETRKFGGILSILWHNSTFNEFIYPGMTNHYHDLLSYFNQNQLEPLSTTDVVRKYLNLMA